MVKEAVLRWRKQCYGGGSNDEGSSVMVKEAVLL